MRVCFTHLGCKLNQAEIEAMARRFAAAGHRLVGSLAEADLHVVNTCTVAGGGGGGGPLARRRRLPGGGSDWGADLRLSRGGPGPRGSGRPGPRRRRGAAAPAHLDRPLGPLRLPPRPLRRPPALPAPPPL